MRVYTIHNSTPSDELMDRFNSANNSRKAIDVFTGIALGLLADETINSKEAAFLHRWIKLNERQLPPPFITSLSPLLSSMASADDIPDEDLKNLGIFLLQAVGHESLETIDEHVGRASGIIYDEISPSEIIFFASAFVLSGSFEKGSKKELKTCIEALGGKPSNGAPSRNTRYVVVGGKGSAQWATSSLGTKIEKALELKSAGIDIKIISETVFWQAHTILTSL